MLSPLGSQDEDGFSINFSQSQNEFGAGEQSGAKKTVDKVHKLQDFTALSTIHLTSCSQVSPTSKLGLKLNDRFQDSRNLS